MSPKRLHVGKDARSLRHFELPAEYALQRHAIFGISGSGKSNTAVALYEELHDVGVPAVTVDPKGDWWGVRSSSDGTGPGLPVPIFGGEHGDIALDPTAGRMFARLIVEKRLSCVIDVSGEEFPTRASMFRFLAEFAGTLLRQNRHPLHVFCEECDEYMPQGGMKAEGGDMARCLGAWQRLVKRGRQHGVGVTMISQRAAAVNIDARNQAETFIAMRQQAPRDVGAVREWMVGPAPAKPTEDETAILASLKALEHGEAWFLSPSWLKVRERVAFRRRRTFDSGATPELGEELVEPATLADVDLTALGQEIADAKERAEADDPEKLRARIRDLEGAHSQGRGILAEKDATIETLRTGVDVLREQVAELEAQPAAEVVPEATIKGLEDYRNALVDWGVDYVNVAGEAIRMVGERIAEAAHLPGMDLPALPEPPEIEQAAGATPAAEGRSILPPRTPPAPVARPDPTPQWPLEAIDAVNLDGLQAGAKRMLQAAARHPKGATRGQIAAGGRVKQSGGSFLKYLTALRERGLIEVEGKTVTPTAAGLAIAGVSPVPEDPAAQIAYWKPKLKAGAQRMLDVLAEAGAAGLSRDELSERARVAQAGGSFTSYLASLRSADLIEDGPDKRVALAPHLLRWS